MKIPLTKPVQLPFHLLKDRGNRIIRKLLSPIAKEQLWAKVPTSSNSTTFSFAMSDHSNVGQKIADFYFRTVYPNIRAQYFEVWLKNSVDSLDLWYLEKAYLHLYKIEDNKQEEFVLLHCDPAFVADETLKATAPEEYNKMLKQVPYKRMLHFHIKKAEPPFPKAHFAMYFGYNQRVLKSSRSLLTAMQFSIQMLKEEILDEM